MSTSLFSEKRDRAQDWQIDETMSLRDRLNGQLVVIGILLLAILLRSL